MVGYDMAKQAAQAVYRQTGVGPEDVDVVELHDCFTANELLTYEASGFARKGVPRISSGAATIPTAENTSPIPPAACCRRGIRSAGYRIGAMHRARLATARASPGPAGRSSRDRVAAQSRTRWRLCRDHVPQELEHQIRIHPARL